MPQSKKAKPQPKPSMSAKPKAKNAVAAKAKPAVKKAAVKKAVANTKPKSQSKANHSAKNSSHKPKPAAKATPPAKQAPPAKPAKPVKLTPFLKEQQHRLLFLRNAMLDSMAGVAKDNLRTRAEGSEASAFGMHQADAGSDAYDRDFALNLLSQEQDALYEIEEALKRVDSGTYGICELCGKPIPQARLEVIPFTRFTVDCQSKLEKDRKLSRSRQPVTSLFGLTDDEEGAEGEEEETPAETKE